MIDEHTEIEAKLAADEVLVAEFKRWAFGHMPVGYERISGPDAYYECGDAVVRHRQDRRDGRHELTVKRRKSAKSTRDREEIDLHFGKKTKPEDVDAFLRAISFKHAFTLVKDAHIFWLTSDGVPLTLVIYEVGRQLNDLAVEMKGGELVAKLVDVRHFIEVEAEKGYPGSKARAKQVVENWVSMLRSTFGLGEPLNESLYEIYSGKRYQSVRDSL